MALASVPDFELLLLLHSTLTKRASTCYARLEKFAYRHIRKLLTCFPKLLETILQIWSIGADIIASPSNHIDLVLIKWPPGALPLR